MTHFIFLAGVSCVGKSTIGARLAELLGFSFCDLDEATEIFFELPIRRLAALYKSEHSFLRDVAQVLHEEIARSSELVVALPPGGLLTPLWQIIKHTRDSVVVLLDEQPEQILRRVCFFDLDSKPVDKILNDRDKARYLQEIKDEIAAYRHSFKRADIHVNLGGRDVDASAHLLLSVLGF